MPTSGDKKRLKSWIEADEMEAVWNWAKERRPWSILIGLLFQPDEVFRWKVVHTLGFVASRFARDDVEPVRELLRRLFWSMNDESGGIVWNAPDAVGEVLAEVPVLLKDFGQNLLSLLDFEPFEDGVHHAAWRWSTMAPEWMNTFEIPLRHSMSSPFPFRRAMAAAAWLGAGNELENDVRVKLAQDIEIFRYYDVHERRFVETGVGAFLDNCP